MPHKGTASCRASFKAWHDWNGPGLGIVGASPDRPSMKGVALEVERELAGLEQLTGGQMRYSLFNRYGLKVTVRAINKWRADPAYRQACDQLRNQARVRLPLADKRRREGEN